MLFCYFSLIMLSIISMKIGIQLIVKKNNYNNTDSTFDLILLV